MDKITNFVPLFARDSKGKIRTWGIKVSKERPNVYKVSYQYGLLTGKKQIHSYLVTEGKNVGKVNETSPLEQAQNEAQSLFDIQRTKGYKPAIDFGVELIPVTQTDPDTLQTYVSYKEATFEGVTRSLAVTLDIAMPKYNTDDKGNFKPMKAQQYYKNVEMKINYLLNPFINKPVNHINTTFPRLAQCKINGVRCVGQIENVPVKEGSIDFDEIEIKLRSKNGNDYPLMKHIEKELFYLVQGENRQICIFDGELYTTKAKYLSEVNSAVRAVGPLTPHIRYYIFDLAIPGVSQKNRLDLLYQISHNGISIYEDQFINVVGNIIFVQSTWVQNDREAQEFTDLAIEAGYEGAIFRDPKATYKFGQRPSTMTKLKRVKQDIYVIVRIEPTQKEPTHGLFVCATETGKEFKVTAMMSNEEKEQLLANKKAYVGKQVSLTFYEYTAEGLPFHVMKTEVL